MDYRIEWSPRAIEDVESIAAYIAADSPAYASTFARKLRDKVRSLSRFPFAGRIVPEFDDENLREQFVYNYRIVYRIKDDVITIVAVIHGKRLIQLELQP